jgi:hypothetical protein
LHLAGTGCIGYCGDGVWQNCGLWFGVAATISSRACIANIAIQWVKLISSTHIAARKKSIAFNARSTSILVIVPTRELAVQVGQVFKQLASDALRVATVFGGVSINPQMLALRGGADIVVATPGRCIRFGRPKRIATR